MNYNTLKDLLKQADAEQNNGNYDQAKLLANEVLTALEESADGLVLSSGASQELRAISTRLLGIVSFRCGDYPAALEYLNMALYISEKTSDKAGMAKALGNIGVVYEHLSDYPKSLEFSVKALSIDEELGNKEGVAASLGNLGNVHAYLSDYPKSLECYGKALSITEELGNKEGVAIHLGNIGIVHRYLSDYPKALEYYGKALSIAEELGNKASVAIWLGNIGIVHMFLLDYPTALEHYGKALSIEEELGNKAGVARKLSNIGNVHRYLSDYPKALEYYNKALSIAEELGNKAGVARHLGNIGRVHIDLYDYSKAQEYLEQSMSLHEKQGEKSEIGELKSALGALYASDTNPNGEEAKAEAYLLESIAVSRELGTKKYEAHKTLAELYKRQKRWEEYSEHYEQYHKVRDEVHSEDAKKSAALMEQRRQIAEREKEIAIAKAAADAKHQATEQLLHNVLPPSIANKMLDGTKLIAEKIPSVSVLFADIVGFTKLSQRITPEELVDGLDRMFSAFDALAEKHGLEKIKTIGDAYMVVSGAPVQREDHAEAMTQFALEMVEAMQEFRSISTSEKVQVRIGIHSGEVVAGVIGKKKFAYDLWGDAVNTAARMESHGEAGKIHVSEEFVRELGMRNEELGMKVKELTGDNSQFVIINSQFIFVPRGEMEIKGKGMMKTYFLEKLSEQDL